MILTRSDATIQLMYTQEEYNEFNNAITNLETKLMALFRNEIPDMQIPVCEDCLKELESNFIHTFHYIDRIMIRTHTDAGVQLTFSVQEFEDFEMNLFAWLRHDLDGYQERYNDRSEYAYADALEDLHSVIDILLPY